MKRFSAQFYVFILAGLLLSLTLEAKELKPIKPDIYNIHLSTRWYKKAPTLSFQTNSKKMHFKIFVNGVYAANGTSAYDFQKLSFKLEKANWKEVGRQKIKIEYYKEGTEIETGIKTKVYNLRKGWLLPRNRANSRFFKDIQKLPRPALSVRGFDNTKMGYYSGPHDNKALGVRQVLDEAYGVEKNQNPLVAKVYQKMINFSTRTLGPPSNFGQNTQNSQILQARAFLALTTYIRDKNHLKKKFHNEPGHSEIRDQLIRTLGGWMVLSRKLVPDYPKADAVKKATTLMNIARVVDLYLALENAYQDLGGETSKLLNKSKKKKLMIMLSKEIKDMYSDAKAGFGLNFDEFQPGNWPLKCFVSAGYASLALQGPKGINYSNPYLDRAMRSAAFKRYTTSPTRMNYWHYQTGEGKAFWAEGAYYFQFALQDVIPFWHAIRANHLLDYSSHGDGTDPFFHHRFTRPLQWLADIAAPDGHTPPLDDGNRHPIMVSGMLRWAPSYGSSPLGKNFARVNSDLGGVGSSPSHYPVEIAIPRLGDKEAKKAPSIVGNRGPNFENEQQLVARHQSHSGRQKHYLLLQGEKNDAISRGEGHEQGDSMQLLYNINGTYYLVDAGYDRPKLRSAKTLKSTWNNYKDHNVMFFGGPGDGGIRDPYISVYRKRIVSKEQHVDHLFYEKKGKITVFHSKIELKTKKIFARKGDYWRNVIFVGDDQNPYFIDLNRLKQTDGNLPYFAMRYHGYSNHFVNKSNPYGHYFRQKWDHWKVQSQDNLNFYMYFRPMTTDVKSFQRDSNFDIMLIHGRKEPISRVTMTKKTSDQSFSTIAIFRASKKAPQYTPARVSSLSGNKDVQAWAIRHDDGQTVDVVAMRSARKLGKSYFKSISFPVSQVGGLTVKLPYNRDFGFFRYKKNYNGYWRLVSNSKYLGRAGKKTGGN